MIDRRTASATTAAIAVFTLACGEPDWRESREPVRTTGYGGSVQPDIAIQYDAPASTIYDPPPDLALRRDSVTQTGDAQGR